MHQIIFMALKKKILSLLGWINYFVLIGWESILYRQMLD